MRSLSLIWIAAVILSCAAIAIAQNVTTEANERRCYHFTWLGPRFDNQSIFRNASCVSNTRLTNEIPCNEPFVVSEDGTWPDVDYIWQNHRQTASCVAVDNDICAQYTFYYNGIEVTAAELWACGLGFSVNGDRSPAAVKLPISSNSLVRVENSTYMCTRAIDNYGQAISSGCYQQVNGSHVTRVCFCQSIRGAIPCNNALTLTLSIFILICAIIVALQEHY